VDSFLAVSASQRDSASAMAIGPSSPSQRFKTSRNLYNAALTGGIAAVLRTPRGARHLSPTRAKPMALLGLNLAIPSAVRSGFRCPGFRFTWPALLSL
jgi:hypothetical protein